MRVYENSIQQYIKSFRQQLCKALLCLEFDRRNILINHSKAQPNPQAFEIKFLPPNTKNGFYLEYGPKNLLPLR